MNSRNGGGVSIAAAGVVAMALAAAVMAAAPGGAAPAVNQNGPTLLEAYKGHFLIGTAGDVPGGFSDAELKLIKDNFNCITPENYLKPAPVHPTEAIWSFRRPDALVKWCNENNIAVHGHTMLWHSQTNPWFFEGRDKATVTKRMNDHITTMVAHYKGKIRSWDVVNEAIDDRGGGGGARGGAGGAGTGAAAGENLRSSNWLQIIGPEFLTIAFKTAHEADPDLKLFYNEYGNEGGAKHEASMALMRRLIKDGAPIFGIGIQGHWSTSGINYANLDKAIADYGSLGLKVSISELDITINGASGGQLPGAGGGAPGGRRGGGAATAPAGAYFDANDEPLFFAAAPAGPAAGGAGARGGAMGGMGGGRGAGGRGGAAATVNPATTIDAVVTDLSADQKANLATVSSDVDTKLAAWQKSSQEALVQVQPQYQANQIAYQNEMDELNAEQAKQNALRDEIYNDAEARLMAVLTPAQAAKWQTVRLNGQFTTQFGALNVTDAQKAKVDPIIAASAKKLASAKDKSAVADGKAEFTKKVLAVLDEAQVTQYQAQTQPNRGGAARGGARGGAPASAAGLKAQADAYARIFAIFEKHKDVVDHVTFWGLNDARSWRGAGSAAVIFDVNNQRKPCYDAIVNTILHPDPALAAPQ